MHDYRTAYQSCLTENRDSNHKTDKLQDERYATPQAASEFCNKRKPLCLFDGLDCHEENFIIDCHKFRVAQFSSIRVCKSSYKVIPEKEFHSINGIGP